MTEIMATESATHEAPVWRAKADFLISADLTSAGLPGDWEQLWAKRVGANEFLICCIPYFTYGLALGDTVRTMASDQRNHAVASIVTRSQRGVLRLWLANATPAVRTRLVDYLDAESLLHEWSSANLIVIDIPLDRSRESILEAVIDDTIEFEWGDQLPMIEEENGGDEKKNNDKD